MRKSSRALLLAIAGIALCATAAHAQYKWVDAEGRIGYSDMPPSTAAKILRGPAEINRPVSLSSRTPESSAELPFDLRRTVERSPVILYTTSDCAPCDLARDHLVRRGVPYTEKIVSSAQDLLAFQRLGFASDTGLPVFTAGAAKQIGYHGTRWDETLSRVGYPKSSRLPASWTAPAAESLAANRTAAIADAAEADDAAPDAQAESQRRTGTRERSAPLGLAPTGPALRF